MKQYFSRVFFFLSLLFLLLALYLRDCAASLDFLLDTLRFSAYVNCVFGIHRDVFLAAAYSYKTKDGNKSSLRVFYTCIVRRLLLNGCYRPSWDSSSVHICKYVRGSACVVFNSRLSLPRSHFFNMSGC